MLNAGTALQGRYEILRIIGQGGMSTVYQARDLIDHKLLAVKEVERTGRADNQVVEQSLDGEGRMLMQLRNRHLPNIYDIIENPESFMLVMDFLEGESLDKVIAREGAQPMEKVLDWGMQICEVLHYLHSQPTPIIYRDMKPANLILQPDGNLMLIDFGTARTQKVGVAMQADTICIGTAGFAAPEQFGGFGQSTARTDIFCLGATLYNLITGHSPYDRPSGILPLEQWDPALADSPISHIIYKCTRNDPDARYQTAVELYDDLRLASVGAFRNPSAKGRSGPLSGGLRKTEWQRQEVKGNGAVSGALSGLLQRGKGASGPLPKKPEPQPSSQPPAGPASAAGWQTGRLQAAVQPVPGSNEIYREPVPEEDSMARKLMLIGAILAGIFAVFAVLLAVFGQTVAAAAFLILTLAGAVLAVVGAVLSRRTGQ